MRIQAVIVASLCAAACNSGDSGDGSPDADRDTFAASIDCNDNDPSVWRTINAFPDADRDGIGAASAVSICAGATTPLGYSSSSTDCADDDATIHTAMPYAARDADGDTVLVAAAGSVCSNGTTLPPRYFAAADDGSADCDDGSASVWHQASLYQDFDGDGVGHGAASSFCLGTGPMPGFVASHFDCAHLDATKWRMVTTYEDVDGDGVGSGTLHLSCVGTVPPPGSSFLGFDPVDTTDPSSSLVSDFELDVANLFIESETDDDDVL